MQNVITRVDSWFDAKNETVILAAFNYVKGYGDNRCQNTFEIRKKGWRHFKRINFLNDNLSGS